MFVTDVLILLEDDELSKLPKKPFNRFVYVLNICSKKQRTCIHCNSIQPKNIKKDTQSICKIIAEWKSDGESNEKKYWNGQDVLNIFKHISDQNVENLGFNNNWCKLNG